MGHAVVVQGLVSVGHIKMRIDEPFGDQFGRLWVTFEAVVQVFTLAPSVGFAALHHGRALSMAPRVQIHIRIGADTESGNHVFAKILILIVAPNEHEVGLEVIQGLAHMTKTLHHGGSVGGRAQQAFILTPFGSHGGWPMLGVFVLGGDGGVLQGFTKNPRHLLIG